MRRIYTITFFCYTRRTSQPKILTNTSFLPHQTHLETERAQKWPRSFCKILAEYTLNSPKHIQIKKITSGAPANDASARRQVLFETLQSVQSIELFNFNRALTDTDSSETCFQVANLASWSSLELDSSGPHADYTIVKLNNWLIEFQLRTCFQNSDLASWSWIEAAPKRLTQLLNWTTHW